MIDVAGDLTPEQRRELLAAQLRAQRQAEPVETTCTTPAAREASAAALLRSIGRRRGDTALHVAGRLYLEHGDQAREVLALEGAPGGVEDSAVDRHLARAGVAAAEKHGHALRADAVSTRTVDMQPRTPLAALVSDALARNRAARAAGPRRLVELAEVLGCDPGTLHAALRGRRRLLRSSDAYVTGETLARALGLEVDQVMVAAEGTAPLG